MRYAYPATLEVEPDGRVTAYFDGLPGATWGETREQALAQAKDLLATAIGMLREDGAAVPPSPPANGRPIVEADVE